MYKALKTLGFGTKTIKIGSKLSDEAVKKIGERGLKILLKSKAIEKTGNAGAVEEKTAKVVDGVEEKKEHGETFGVRKK